MDKAFPSQRSSQLNTNPCWILLQVLTGVCRAQEPSLLHELRIQTLGFLEALEDKEN